MRKVITAVLSLAYLHVCHAETASVTEIIAYEGTVAGSGIFMTLSETDGDIIGGYHGGGKN